MKKFLTGNIMIVVYIIIAFLLSMGIISLLLSGTLSKYSFKESYNHSITTDAFYFVSNKLSKSGNVEVINNYHATDITFDIRNGVSENYSSEDITYDITCEVPTGYTCYIDNSTSNSSFTLTHGSDVVTNEHTIRVENISGNLDSVEVTVNASSITPYVKNLTGTFILNTGGSATSASVSVLSETLSYCAYTIKNNGSTSEYITAGFDTSKYALDEESSTFFQNRAYYSLDENGNYNSITTNMPALSSYYLVLTKYPGASCMANDITLSYGSEPVQSYTLVNDQNSNGILDTGDEIAFGSEHFYVISNSKGYIKALAKYNLYVGGTYNASGNDTSDTSDLNRYTLYGSEATGLQNASMEGRNPNNSSKTIYTGVVRFNNDSIVSSYAESSIKNYVDTYVEYLNTNNPNANITGRLITKTELDFLGCDGSPNNDSTNRCNDGYSWATNRGYWGMTTGQYNNVWSGYYWLYYASNQRKMHLGVRPVIEFYDAVQASITPEYNIVEDQNQNGGLEIGDIISFDNEEFIIMYNENGHVAALAAFNLNVGNNLVPNATEGLQNPWAKGFTEDHDAPYYGCVTFANNNGWSGVNTTINLRSYPGEINSALYGVSGYENHLKSYIPSIEMHLMTLDNLVAMGYPRNSGNNDWRPSGIPLNNRINVSSWLGYSGSTATQVVAYSSSYGALNVEYNANSGSKCFGIRPVIEFDM